MRRFSAEDVQQILSWEHKRNTAEALHKAPECVTNDELIEHWLKHHVQMEVLYFNVDERSRHAS